MSRNVGVGLDYFSVGTQIEGDRKIKLLEAKFPLVGFAVYLKLLCRIYKENYFIAWDDEEHLLFAQSLPLSSDQLTDILEEFFKRGLLSFELKKKYGILTSSGIQKQYIESTRRRKFITFHREFLLLSEQELSDYSEIKTIAEIRIVTCPVIFVTTNEINVTEKEEIVTFNTQRKLKETKVNEREGETPALPITFEYLKEQVSKNCQLEKFSRFNPHELSVKLSHVIKANGFEKANGKKVANWDSQIYLLMEKELEFQK